MPLRIVVRAAPEGHPARPEPGQRLVEGARRYRILAVAETDAAGLYLTCFAREEAAHELWRGGGPAGGGVSSGWPATRAWGRWWARRCSTPRRSGALPPIYVALGSEDVLDRSDMTGHGAAHDIIVTVIADAGGFQLAKAAAGRCRMRWSMPRWRWSAGTLVSLQFLRARARQAGDGQTRRIDLRFRARVEDQ